MSWRILAIWRGKNYDDICDYNFENLCMCIQLHRNGSLDGFIVLKDDELTNLDFTDLNLEKIEREILMRALKQEGFQQARAAARLGISARSLNYKIHNIHRISINGNGKK